MPTRPTSTPEWASGASRRIEPSAGQKSDGFVGGERTAAKIGNWIIGFASDWIGYFAAIIDANEEHTYQVPKSRTIKIGPFVGHDAGVNADTASGWGGVTATMGAGDTTSSLVSRENSADWVIELGAAAGGVVIPHGAVVTRIRVLVDPGAARATVNQRMSLYFVEAQYDLDSPGLTSGTWHVNDVPDDGTTNLQAIDSGTISVTIDRSKRYYVRVIAGADAASNPDRVHVFEITFTDPGPRNA